MIRTRRLVPRAQALATPPRIVLTFRSRIVLLEIAVVPGRDLMVDSVQFREFSVRRPIAGLQSTDHARRSH
jgi:hypothetical protein